MKMIAIILAGCMLMLNAGHLLEIMHSPVEMTAMDCSTDDSSDCCNSDEKTQDSEKAQDSKKACHGDAPCMPGCACSCDYQLSALVYSFLELNGTVVQSYHYGNYLNTYTFEYSSDFLQPPRMV